jgi:3-dehydroquinate synthase
VKTLTVDAASRKYDILIGPGAIAELPRALGARRAVIVTDANVAPLYAERVLDVLERAGIDAVACGIAAGERNKTLATVERLYNEFAERRLTRSDAVVALGGGVVGDIAGFAAATYMRGIDVVQVPTTLVAMTDSSVGGKTGVDLPQGKNLVGAFHQPSAVIADTDFLATLPERELRAGLAEVTKYYCLGETALAELIPGGDIAEIVYLCCRAKARYVAEDERDTGARAALNFGHTFGHAIEKYFGYARYNHGEAVAIGMRLALETGEKLGITERGAAESALRLFEAAGLDTALDIPERELVALMGSDKKNTRDALRLVLLRRIGEPVLREITAAELEALL